MQHAWEIENHELLVIPSLSFPYKELATLTGSYHYEERILFVLLALGAPLTRLVIVTTMPLDDWIIKYYFALISPGLDISGRVQFYSVGDPSPQQSLALKILDRPRLLRRLKHSVATFRNPSLLINRGTEVEERLAAQLGIPYYAANPQQAVYGTKHGSRDLFRKLQIPCADGTYEAETDLDAFIEEIWKVLRRNPRATIGIVKLSDSFSGKGNAIMDLSDVQARLRQLETSLLSCELGNDPELRQLTMVSLENMKFHSRTWVDFREELEELGAIFELFIDLPVDGDDSSDQKRCVTSPSVQAVINEDGSLSILSTHEQILDNQVYLGCEFPCLVDYRQHLMLFGRQIGEYLRERGVRGHFSVDFLCVPRSSKNEWDIYGIEVNLRITGTTLPFMMLRLLTHGDTCEVTGLFQTPIDHIAKFYVSSDNVSDPSLRRLVPQDLFEIIANRPDLHWDSMAQTGVFFHMLGCLSECGKIGMTAVANSLEEARTLFIETNKYIIKESNCIPFV